MGASVDEGRSKVLHARSAAHLLLLLYAPTLPRDILHFLGNRPTAELDSEGVFVLLSCPGPRGQTRGCHPRWSRGAFRVQADSGEPRSHDSAESPNKRCSRRDMPDTSPLPTTPLPPSALIPWTNEQRPERLQHHQLDGISLLAVPSSAELTLWKGQTAESTSNRPNVSRPPATLCNVFKA